MCGERRNYSGQPLLLTPPPQRGPQISRAGTLTGANRDGEGSDWESEKANRDVEGANRNKEGANRDGTGSDRDEGGMEGGFGFSGNMTSGI